MLAALLVGMLPRGHAGEGGVVRAADTDFTPNAQTYARPSDLLNYNTTGAGSEKKIIFGKDKSVSKPQEWWITGGVYENNKKELVLYAADPLGPNRQFHANQNNHPFSSSWNVAYDNTTGAVDEVYANHYGGADIRVGSGGLHAMAKDTGYFTGAEQALMLRNDIWTKDNKNGKLYQTNHVDEKLYLPYGILNSNAGIWAGETDNLTNPDAAGNYKIAMKYVNQNSWLRAPYPTTHMTASSTRL